MADFINDFRDDLCGTGATSNDTDLKSREIKVVAPVSSMPCSSFEALSSGGVAELGPIEAAHALRNDIGEPVLDVPSFIFNQDMPDKQSIVPEAGFDKGIETSAALELIIMRKLCVV